MHLSTGFALFVLIFANYSLFAQTRFAYGTGCLYDSARYANVPLTAPLMRGGEIPVAHSLREYCPTPMNQGMYGTCTAWASAYAARSILLGLRGDSPKHTFSPSYIYNQIRLLEGCDYGVYIADALELLKNEGCVPYSDFGYDCEKPVTAAHKKKAKSFVIKDFKKLFVRSGTVDLNSFILPVKKALSENKPIVISIKCWASLENAKDLWEPAENDEQRGYHAVTVVAYDDNLYGGAFQIMNSWGLKWGRGGFTWIKYKDFQENCMEAYEPVDFPYNPNVPSIAIGGDMVFKKADNTEMNVNWNKKYYQMNETHYTGTAFQFFVSHLSPTYLYAIGTDLSGKCSLLFPYDKSVSPLLSHRQGTLAFPDEKYYIRLDEQKGKDYICILYSQQALDIKAIMEKMERIQGDIDVRLSQAVGKDLLANSVQYDRKKASFQARISTQAKNQIVPLIVEIKHD